MAVEKELNKGTCKCKNICWKWKLLKRTQKKVSCTYLVKRKST